MKALQLTSIDQLDLVETAIPTIQDNELLIKTGASTICTSDVNDLHRNPFGIRLPVILGHEASGLVSAVGSGVHGFKIGDRVATHPVHHCGKCQPCLEGAEHMCLNMGHFGFNLPGTYAEYYKVRQDRARLLPDTVSFSTGALAEPVCVCLEALSQARLTPASSLLILGDGPFGVMMTRLAARLPLERVVLSGFLDFRLSLAHQSIPVNLANAAEPDQVLLTANLGRPFDAAILAVGSRQAFTQGMELLKPKGRMVIFSAIPEDTPVDLFQVHLKELEILGACSDQHRFDEAVGLLNEADLNLPELVTHHFRLEEYQQAFNMAEFGKSHAMKVAFVFNEK